MTGSDVLPPVLAAPGRLGPYLLVPRRTRPLGRSGWREFALELASGEGVPGSPAVIEGIYSRGGKDGVRPWMDVEYREEVVFREGSGEPRRLSLGGSGLGESLFMLLGEAIPPGGHLMVSYEGGQAIHDETLAALGAGCPPAATPIGRLLVLAGFPRVKDWYLAEGGMEGPRKLWGEKAPDEEWERRYREATSAELRAFLGRPHRPAPGRLLEAARGRAMELEARLARR